jgi:hypothetical protein
LNLKIQKIIRILDLGLVFGFHGFLDDFWVWMIFGFMIFFWGFGFWVSHPNPIQKPNYFGFDPLHLIKSISVLLIFIIFLTVDLSFFLRSRDRPVTVP